MDKVNKFFCLQSRIDELSFKLTAMAALLTSLEKQDLERIYLDEVEHFYLSLARRALDIVDIIRELKEVGEADVQ
ncbi:MAG: hypothetical protein QXT64_07000 [Desulfurococcaceae archaeon]